MAYEAVTIWRLRDEFLLEVKHGTFYYPQPPTNVSKFIRWKFSKAIITNLQNKRVTLKSCDKLWMMNIDNDNHWLIRINCHQLSSIVINCHQSSSIVNEGRHPKTSPKIGQRCVIKSEHFRQN